MLHLTQIISQKSIADPDAATMAASIREGWDGSVGYAVGLQE
jgi:hypothetical protein